VSKGTLYLYFDSKEALFKAVIREGIVPILEEGAGLVDNFAGSAADLLRALISEWWQRIGNTPLAGVSKLMISEAGNFPELATYYHDTVIVRGRDLMRRTLQRGIASGEFRAVDVETAIDIIFAPVLMMVIWRYSLGVCCGKANDPQVYLRNHFDLTLAGLAAPKRGRAKR
jgi:AcrR family transcriptional regulator